MRLLIVDNVNNLSGAPAVASRLSQLLAANVVCIREEPGGSYRSVCCGIRASRPLWYPLGVLLLLFRPTFWREWIVAEAIVFNTSLVFPFLLLAKICGKKSVAILHECFYKNLLYSIGIRATLWAAGIIVTPSAEAYRALLGRRRNWRVIANPLPAEYFESRAATERHSEGQIRILFAGDSRAFKGRDLYRAVADILTATPDGRWICHEVGDDGYRKLHGDSRKLTSDVYDSYDFVLVLTDNRIWRETFGMVGCEAACRGCIPLFTDGFAYKEIWAPFAADLYLPDRRADAIARRLQSLAVDGDRMNQLRRMVSAHAATLCGSSSVQESWRRLLAEVESSHLKRGSNREAK
jgi:hypothetical protein